MAQLPVLSYQLQVNPVTPGRLPSPIVPRLFLEVEGLPHIVRLPLESHAAFASACALLQSPGRLVFETELRTLEKVFP